VIMKIFPRKTLLFLFSICLIALLLCLIESIFFLINRSGQDAVFVQSGEYPGHFFQNDDLLGYKPLSNSKLKAKKSFNNTEVYDIVYSFDQYNRRITPVVNNAGRNKPLLFFGCSFMMGEGVSDDQTLPYYLSGQLPDYMPYNYGCIGYGPQEMLAKLKSDSIKYEVKGSNAVLIYIFIDHQINRVIGSYSFIAMWGKNMPYYRIGKNDNLERHSSFIKGRPVLTSLYLYLAKTQLGKYIINHGDLPPITAEHARLTAKIIEESYKEFRGKFNSDNFFVVIYPPGTDKTDMVKSFLIKNGIKVLEYPSEKQFWGNDYNIPHDVHPNKKAYNELSLLVASSLQKYGIK